MNTRSPMHTAMLALCAVALSGCNSLIVWNFKRSDDSGVGKGKVLVEPYVAAAGAFASKVDGTAFPSFASRLGQCRSSPAGAGPQSVATILVPAVGKLIFDVFADKQIRDLKALKESSTASYSARITLTGNDLYKLVGDEGCVVLLRFAEGDQVPQFVAILALKPLPAGVPATAFTFQPIYVSARSAVAVTKQSPRPAVSGSFAIALRGIGKQDNGLPTLAPIGEASVTVPQLLLGRALGNRGEKCLEVKSCPASDPIPLYGTPGPVSMGVAVTEKGDVGIDFDAAEAELKAIKEAMGPAFKDVIKDKLED